MITQHQIKNIFKYDKNSGEFIRLNNSWSNLRSCSRIENCRNNSQRKNNKTGCVGVSFYASRNKYRATITVNRKHIFLGYFESIDSALEARKKASVTHNFHINHGIKIN